MQRLFWLVACVLGVITLAVGIAAAAGTEAVTETPGNDQEPVKIAAIYAKSGEAARDNLELFQAVRFAVEEYNAKSGSGGRKIELLEYDNHSTPIQSRQAAKQAVNDGAVAVIGASWSSHSMAIAPYLQKQKIPMLAPDSTHPAITKVGDYIFRACFNDNYQGKALALFSRNYLSAATAVIFQNLNSDYSMGLAQSFEKVFTEKGGKVLKVQNYKSGPPDFKALLAEVKKLDPDLLFVPGHQESGYIVKQAQEMGLRAKLLGGDGWPCSEFYANGGQDLKEGYYAAHWNKGVDSQKSRDFIERYGKVYEVTDFAAIAYDAAMLLFDAVQRAADTSPKAIRDALASTKNFAGVTGNITFDADGDPLNKQVVIMRITDGRPKLLMIMMPGL